MAALALMGVAAWLALAGGPYAPVVGDDGHHPVVDELRRGGELQFGIHAALAGLVFAGTSAVLLVMSRVPRPGGAARRLAVLLVTLAVVTFCYHQLPPLWFFLRQWPLTGDVTLAYAVPLLVGSVLTVALAVLVGTGLRRPGTRRELAGGVVVAWAGLVLASVVTGPGWTSTFTGSVLGLNVFRTGPRRWRPSPRRSPASPTS